MGQIARDKYGIICQVQDDGSLDGGDSDNRTGIMALCGSEPDIALLEAFLINGKVVRHPYYAAWDNPANTSRDQIVCYFAPAAECQKEAALAYAQSWFINKDFLDPAVRLYLYKTADVKPPVLIALFGYALLSASLLWNCFIKPNDEQNQFICICNRMGASWLRRLRLWHPRLLANVNEYWSGWRAQRDIGIALCNHIIKVTGAP